MTTTVTRVTQLRAERRPDALGLGSQTPNLSWQIGTGTQNWKQSAYELELTDSEGQKHLSGRVESDESIWQPWPFAPLNSRGAGHVRVRVWDSDGNETPWSEPLSIEAGLLDVTDWQARFITPAAELDASPLLRREFQVDAGLESARLYVSALGLYEAQINGQRVGDEVLSPGWTSYDHRLRYQTFDVTDLLHEGKNAIGAMLGDGWYKGRLGFNGGRRNIFGSEVGLLAQLELTYAYGRCEVIATDEHWQAAPGPIVQSSIYDGESYDARKEQEGWSKAGLDASGWVGVRLLERDFTTLQAPVGPPVRRTQELPVKEILTSPSGKTLVDFGQNLVGWVRLRVQGQAGQMVTLKHAEVLEHGELGVRPLRTAEQTDHYTLKDNEIEVWEPRFTFHGFRYVEVEDWPGELKPEDLTAIVVHSDMERTGWFECSDELVNRLHENVVWGMRGNFVDVPTDCPQRDERLGWTGDAQIFAPTASFLYDVDGFFTSWLADLTAEQDERGVPPFVIPNILGESAQNLAAAWTDATTIIPWVLYQRYGDKDVLERQFASMCAWVDYLDRFNGPARLWDEGLQFGDWLDPSAPPDQPGAAKTDAVIVATAYFKRSAELVSQAAAVLGKTEQAAHYAKLAQEVKAAFAREYVTPAGRLMCDAVTAYALALTFDLLDTAEQRQRAGERLDTLVREAGYTIATGFVGTPIVCDALCLAGHTDSAYRLLLQKRNPSWLYAVKMGATTIWERWDSMLPDGSINPGEMTSFNHYALGAVADWLHRTVAGLAPAAPGYKHISIAPQPGRTLTSAQARHLTPYGEASVKWERQDGKFHLQTIIPPNTTAEVHLPGQTEPQQVGSGTHEWTLDWQPEPHAFPAPDIQMRLCDLWPDEELMSDLLRVAGEISPPLAHLYAPGSNVGKVPLAASLNFLPGGTDAQPAIEKLFGEYREKRGAGA